MIKILIVKKRMKKALFEHYCFIFCNVHQNNNDMGRSLPPTSGQTPPTSGFSDWPNKDPHIIGVGPIISILVYPTTPPSGKKCKR